MKHVAYLTAPEGFTPVARVAVAPGVALLSGMPSDSKTLQGYAYEFDTAEGMLAFLSGKNISVHRFEQIEEESATQDFEMELAAVGKWTVSDGREVDITEAFLAECANNSNAFIADGSLRAPAKLGHDPNQSTVKALFPEGGEPALGWLDAFTVRNGKIWATVRKAPKRFVELLKRNTWRTRSIEIHHDYMGSGKPAVIGIAFLGATRPAIPTLADIVGLQASDIETTFTAVGCFADGAVIHFAEAEPAPGSPGATDGTNESGEGTPPATEPDSQTENKAMSEALTAENTALKAQMLAFAETTANAEATRAAQDDRILPAQIENTKKVLMAAAAAGPEMFTLAVNDLRDRPKLGTIKPVGNAGAVQLSEDQKTAASLPKRADDRLKLKVEARMKADGISYEQAYTLTAHEDPKLYQEYTALCYRMKQTGEPDPVEVTR